MNTRRARIIAKLLYTCFREHENEVSKGRKAPPWDVLIAWIVWRENKPVYYNGLAKELKLSRTTVRRAISRLRRVGLVQPFDNGWVANPEFLKSSDSWKVIQAALRKAVNDLDDLHPSKHSKVSPTRTRARTGQKSSVRRSSQ